MRELQGGDGNDDIPEAEIEPEAEQEPIPEAGKEMHIAEPDAVSLKECEENKDDVPPPPTTDESATDESAERPSVGETEDTSADGEGTTFGRIEQNLGVVSPLFGIKIDSALAIDD